MDCLSWKRSLSILVIGATIGIVLLGWDAASIDARTASIESQVLGILENESGLIGIKAGIAGVSCSSGDKNEQRQDSPRRSDEEELTNRFTSNLLREIDRSGNPKKISIIERGKLEVILKEKELQVTGLTDETASSIGGLAGLDVILLGSCRGDQGPALTAVKAIRVKDGKILGVAMQKNTQIPLVDILTDVRSHSWNTVPLNIEEGGMVTVTLTVERGNAVNVDLMTSAEFDKFKREKKYKDNSSFEAKKTKSYRRSAYLAPGEYLLVISDKALGVASHHTSDIRVTAYLETE